MYPVYLKVKIKELAEETRIIRKEERKVLKRAAELRNDSLLENTQPKLQRLAGLYMGLRNHRRGYNRMIQVRAANIAYGFVRGKKYHEIENSEYLKRHRICGKDDPTSFNKRNPYEDLWRQVARLIWRYGQEFVQANGYGSVSIVDQMRETQVLNPAILEKWIDESRDIKAPKTVRPKSTYVRAAHA